jgi:hypothetical protein
MGPERPNLLNPDQTLLLKKQTFIWMFKLNRNPDLGFCGTEDPWILMMTSWSLFNLIKQPEEDQKDKVGVEGLNMVTGGVKVVDTVKEGEDGGDDDEDGEHLDESGNIKDDSNSDVKKQSLSLKSDKSVDKAVKRVPAGVENVDRK